jgi:hypothetical protein
MTGKLLFTGIHQAMTVHKKFKLINIDYKSYVSQLITVTVNGAVQIPCPVNTALHSAQL